MWEIEKRQQGNFSPITAILLSSLETYIFFMIHVPVIGISNMTKNIMDGIECITCKSDLLNRYTLLDEACS